MPELKNIGSSERIVSEKVWNEAVEMLGRALKNDSCLFAEVDRQAGRLKAVIQMNDEVTETVVMIREKKA